MTVLPGTFSVAVVDVVVTPVEAELEEGLGEEVVDKPVSTVIGDELTSSTLSLEETSIVDGSSELS